MLGTRFCYIHPVLLDASLTYSFEVYSPCTRANLPEKPYFVSVWKVEHRRKLGETNNADFQSCVQKAALAQSQPRIIASGSLFSWNITTFQATWGPSVKSPSAATSVPLCTYQVLVLNAAENADNYSGQFSWAREVWEAGEEQRAVHGAGSAQDPAGGQA